MMWSEEEEMPGESGGDEEERKLNQAPLLFVLLVLLLLFVLEDEGSGEISLLDFISTLLRFPKSNEDSLGEEGSSGDKDPPR